MVEASERGVRTVESRASICPAPFRGKEEGDTVVRNFMVLTLVTLLVTSSSISVAKQRKATHKPGYASPLIVEPYLLPEAVRMREAQKNWPNVPLCDDGGYRIRPCSIEPGGGGRP
jgi:hypothetical protein